MKLIVTPKDYDNLISLAQLGVKDFIVYPDTLAIKNASAFNCVDLKKASSYCQEHDYNLYLAINKILHNDDLESLTNLMRSLTELNVTGIIYADYAVYITAIELGLKIPLHYDGDMLATNSFTTTYINDELVFLSKELHFEEIEEISSKVKGDVCIQVQGLIGMFHSLRPLIKNYKDYLKADFDEKAFSNQLYDEERDLYYPILETKDGSFIMGGKEVCLIDQLDLLDEIKVTYLKIDGFMQSSEYLNKVSTAYLKAIELYQNDKSGYKEGKKEFIKEVEDISSRPLDKGFFFKPTLYKVKK